MAKILLKEFFNLCPDGRCGLDLLTEEERHEVKNGAMYLQGVCQKKDTRNQNSRRYPSDVLEREVNNYLKLVKENRALGECDHSENEVVNLKNASHLITNLWWKGNDLWCKAKVLSTPAGQILRSLVNDGVQLGISSRALGSLSEGGDGTKIVGDDLQLICWDFVSEPSTTGAFMHIAEGLQRKYYTNVETKADRINRLINDFVRGA